MISEIIGYFKNGFLLANKSWDILLFGLSISLLDNIPELMVDPSTKSVLQIAVLFLMFIQFGYYFSLPLFLVKKQQEKTLDIGNIFSFTLKNTKRLLLPTILFIFLIIISIILIYILIVQFLFNGDFSLAQGSYIFTFWIILFIALFSPFTFAPIFFTLEEKNFVQSLKMSISLSLKNINFIIIIFFISIIVYLISQSIQSALKPYGLFINDFIYEYEALLLTSASLFLYQKNKKLITLSSKK